MNPKILLAFVGGAAAAGALALVLTYTRGEQQRPVVVDNRPVVTVEREVAMDQPATSADVAASMEAVRPGPQVKREKRLPKPAPVEVKTSKVVEPVAPVAAVAQEAPPAQPTRPEIIWPKEPSAAPEPAKPVHEEAARTEILRPDSVAKPPAARVPETVTVPAGTTISVRINSTLSSEKNIVGDKFTATLESPLVIDNVVLAERGAKVEGKVAEVDRSGRVKGTARLALVLTRIQLSDGQRVALETDPWERVAESSKKSDAAKVGIMAGIGAAIGAIAGGGKGAAIGAASGAGAGGGVVLASRGKPAQVDVETRIPFRLSNALTVTEKID
jgi:hypothetical protein